MVAYRRLKQWKIIKLFPQFTVERWSFTRGFNDMTLSETILACWVDVSLLHSRFSCRHATLLPTSNRPSLSSRSHVNGSKTTNSQQSEFVPVSCKYPLTTSRFPILNTGVHGSSYPPFQALHRRISSPSGSNLHSN